MEKGEARAKHALKAQRADGSAFDASMEFTSATYEGEPCLQIVFRQQTSTRRWSRNWTRCASATR
jgi:hypothetical protein